jgi:hypothetical protein
MIRSLSRLFVVALCLVLLFPSPVSASKAARAFAEGIYISSSESHHRSLSVTINAIKHVDGKWRQSEVSISYHYSFYDGTRDFDATVILDGDPDLLEVSKDLGWGGLDTVIYVQWRKVVCVVAPTHSCQPEVVETIPVELHLAVFTEGAVEQSGGWFTRNAPMRPGGVVGTIKTPDKLTNIEIGQGMISSGHTFSDQYPG